MRKWFIPGMLLACLVTILLWTIMAGLHRRPFQPFSITAADFLHFAPTSTVGVVRTIRLDPDEPGAINIMALQIVSAGGARQVIRLAHGYNMPMCMKIKGYRVEEISGAGQRGAEGEKVGDRRNQQPLIQVWRLTSSTGAHAVWITRILRAADLLDANLDVCSLPFPRVGIPDDPGWNPQGIGWAALRHPVRWFRQSLRSAWNSARCDLAVFLRFKQPAWASDELLTMVASSELVTEQGDLAAVIHRLEQEQSSILCQARDYQRDGKSGGSKGR